jgi:hypothetical protein
MSTGSDRTMVESQQNVPSDFCEYIQVRLYVLEDLGKTERANVGELGLMDTLGWL